jgi:hypothetical protein
VDIDPPSVQAKAGEVVRCTRIGGRWGPAVVDAVRSAKWQNEVGSHFQKTSEDDAKKELEGMHDSSKRKFARRCCKRP